MIGRPTDYTPELADRICHLVSTHSISLNKICAKYDDIPAIQTIKNWRRIYPEFMAMYLTAKEEQCLSYIEDLADSMDDVEEKSEAIAKQTLRFRYYQWQLAKLSSKIFGDKKQVTQEMNINVHERDLQDLK